jgi:hypothetical protein
VYSLADKLFTHNNPRFILGVVFCALFLNGLPLRAQVASRASAANQAVNTQNAIGSVNQSPIGGVNNNTQVNNSQATDYGFAPGIVCRGPTLGIGAFGASASSDFRDASASADNYGAVVGFNLPLPTRVNQLCQDLAEEILLQKQLDTSLTLIKQCAILQKEGIAFDPEIFPEFKKCDGVKIGSGKFVSKDDALNSRPFNSQDKTYVTTPVR